MRSLCTCGHAGRLLAAKVRSDTARYYKCDTCGRLWSVAKEEAEGRQERQHTIVRGRTVPKKADP